MYTQKRLSINSPIKKVTTQYSIKSKTFLLTPLATFEILKNGDDINTIRKEIPEEHLAAYDEMVNKLELKFMEAKANFMHQAVFFIGKSLKEIGIYVQNENKNINPVFKSLIFAYIKNESQFDARMNKTLWESVRPNNNIIS